MWCVGGVCGGGGGVGRDPHLRSHMCVMQTQAHGPCRMGLARITGRISQQATPGRKHLEEKTTYDLYIDDLIDSQLTRHKNSGQPYFHGAYFTVFGRVFRPKLRLWPYKMREMPLRNAPEMMNIYLI